MLASTALFLGLLLFLLAEFAASEGGAWVQIREILVSAVLITASQATLFLAAAKWFEHKCGTKTADTLVLIGCAIFGVRFGIVSWLAWK